MSGMGHVCKIVGFAPVLSLQGNPYCRTESQEPDGRRCFCEQYCAISEASKKRTDWKAIVISTVLCGFLLVSVILYLDLKSLTPDQQRHLNLRAKRFTVRKSEFKS